MAAAEAGVKRVVFTSSIGTVHMNPNRNPDALVDESCWSDLDFLQNTKNYYCYGKTAAEMAAWEVATEKGVDLVVVCLAVVLGPLLQSSVNVSTIHILKYWTGSVKTYANGVQVTFMFRIRPWLISWSMNPPLHRAGTCVSRACFTEGRFVASWPSCSPGIPSLPSARTRSVQRWLRNRTSFQTRSLRIWEYSS
ncbi:hypothetical protein Droror1_Dr00013603 [Drosera rotundifolia]